MPKPTKPNKAFFEEKNDMEPLSEQEQQRLTGGDGSVEAEHLDLDPELLAIDGMGEGEVYGEFEEGNEEIPELTEEAFENLSEEEQLMSIMGGEGEDGEDGEGEDEQEGEDQGGNNGGGNGGIVLPEEEIWGEEPEIDEGDGSNEDIFFEDEDSGQEDEGDDENEEQEQGEGEDNDDWVPGGSDDDKEDENLVENLFDNNKLKFSEGASDEFKEKVKITLNKLVNSDTGKAILEELSKLTIPVTFKEVATSQDFSITSDTREIAINLDAVTKENLSDDGALYTFYVESFTHELFHAIQLERGLFEDGGKKGVNLAREAEALLSTEKVLNEMGLEGYSLQSDNVLVEEFKDIIQGEEELTVDKFNDFLDNYSEKIINAPSDDSPYKDPDQYYIEHIESLDDILWNL